MMASTSSSSSSSAGAAETSSSSSSLSSFNSSSSTEESFVEDIYQFKITLQDVKPPIWRRIQVDGDISFGQFHLVINSCMGWENSHLYQFYYKNMIISERVMEEPSFLTSPFSLSLFGLARNQELDSSETKIKHFFKDRGIKTLTYVYDFGDNWRHKVTLEKMVPRGKGKRYPLCVTGRRACPPEDCGGIYGYESLLSKLADPTHEEHDHLKSWMEENGHENFDPNKFNLAQTNATLAFY